MNPKIINKFQLEKIVRPIVTGGEDKCQQHFKDECDINKIIAKYNKTGILQHVTKARAMYGDFTQFAPFAENMDKVAKATQLFDDLPAELRNHFGNSIPGFFNFITQEKNRQQCIEWGIFDPPPKKEEPQAPTPPSAAQQPTQAPVPTPSTK